MRVLEKPPLLIVALVAAILPVGCISQKSVGVEGGDTDPDAAVEAAPYTCPLLDDGGPPAPEVCGIFTDPGHPWQEGCCTDAGLVFTVEEYVPESDAGWACIVSKNTCGLGTHCCFSEELAAHTCCED